MLTRPLGTSNIQASTVAFGGWAIGGWRWGGTDDTQAVKAIHAAIDCGMNMIDTAPVYGFGLSESIIGTAIQGKRDKVVLATKCGLVCDPNRGTKHFRTNVFNFDDDGLIQVNRCNQPDSIKLEVEGSLRRLKTDYIDLYQTHWQDPTTPIADTMSALLDLKQQGKIRAIGVSNATSQQMQEYRDVGPLDSDQERYSMLDRALEKDQLPYCHKHGVSVLAYSPLGQGLLTGKLVPGREFPVGDLRYNNPKFSDEVRRKVAAMLAKFQPIADAHGVTLAQIVIAWTIAQPGLTHALCGARTPEQVLENAKAGHVTLTDADLTTMNAAVAAYA
ncbi:MAG: aldo/keto reductase [Phycisphaeraceae bacterium]